MSQAVIEATQRECAVCKRDLPTVQSQSEPLCDPCAELAPEFVAMSAKLAQEKGMTFSDD